MSSQTPGTNQPQTLTCYLSPLDDHESLVADLNNTALLYSLSPNLLISKTQLLSTLVTRYEGTSASWRIRLVHRGFLVSLPNWLYRDELHLDSSYWERQGLVVQPWQALDGSFQAPPTQRVFLTITDFPLDFWHPYYIRQAMVPMGTVAGIHSECIVGDNRTAIWLWLDTPDPGLIPFILYVGHKGRSTDC